MLAVHPKAQAGIVARALPFIAGRRSELCSDNLQADVERLERSSPVRTGGAAVKELTKNLPQPVTLADSVFMKNLLAGVRKKRQMATGREDHAHGKD